MFLISYFHLPGSFKTYEFKVNYYPFTYFFFKGFVNIILFLTTYSMEMCVLSILFIFVILFDTRISISFDSHFFPHEKTIKFISHLTSSLYTKDFSPPTSFPFSYFTIPLNRLPGLSTYY